jgi:hypothetical protein
MKTITCKQLGGPCDTVFHANTADEAIKLQDKHLKGAVAAGETLLKLWVGITRQRKTLPLYRKNKNGSN